MIVYNSPETMGAVFFVLTFIIIIIWLITQNKESTINKNQSVNSEQMKNYEPKRNKTLNSKYQNNPKKTKISDSLKDQQTLDNKI